MQCDKKLAISLFIFRFNVHLYKHGSSGYPYDINLSYMLYGMVTINIVVQGVKSSTLL